MIHIESRQSQQLYQDVALRYEQVFERATLAESEVEYLVLKHLTGRCVLDLGCGNARWLERFNPKSYVGLDLSDKMLAQACVKAPKAEFLQANMSELPIKGESFDAVVSLFGAMGHIPPTAQRDMIREIVRVLRPGGISIITNGNMWSPFNLPNTLRANRIKIEGIKLKVHSATPSSFKSLLSEFLSVESIQSYDFSYLPIGPIKLGAVLLGKDYQQAYAEMMRICQFCTEVPGLQWMGKQLVAVCRKECQ